MIPERRRRSGDGAAQRRRRLPSEAFCPQGSSVQCPGEPVHYDRLRCCGSGSWVLSGRRSDGSSTDQWIVQRMGHMHGCSESPGFWRKRETLYSHGTSIFLQCDAQRRGGQVNTIRHVQSLAGLKPDQTHTHRKYMQTQRLPHRVQITPRRGSPSLLSL